MTGLHADPLSGSQRMELSRPTMSCTPPVWARGGHSQTLLGHLLPSSTPQLRSVPQQLHRIRLPDGDSLVAWHCRGKSNVQVLLLHGLGGDARSDYIRRTADACLQEGHSVLALNHRGCGAGHGLARGAYHSGRADDVSAALAFGRQLEPESRQLAIGFSLSGNAVLLLLGKHMQPAPDFAIAVNPPIDLARCSERISWWSNRMYDLRFVYRCRRALEERVSAGLVKPGTRIPPLATLRDVDELYTAPAGGFADANDYYRRCSAKPLLSKINTPTVILTAKDDPFVPVEDFETADLSSQVFLHMEPTGGHMGYLSKHSTPLGTRRWLDYALISYVRQLVAQESPQELAAAAAAGS